MKSNQIKPIEIGYGEEKIIFHLRMVSIAEEEEYARRFSDVADDADKHKKEFEICKEALGEFSIALPETYKKEKGEQKKVPLASAETASGAINEYFAERTAQKERIIRDAYFLFKRQLAPEARFLDISAS